LNLGNGNTGAYDCAKKRWYYLSDCGNIMAIVGPLTAEETAKNSLPDALELIHGIEGMEDGEEL